MVGQGVNSKPPDADCVLDRTLGETLPRDVVVVERVRHVGDREVGPLGGADGVPSLRGSVKWQ